MDKLAALITCTLLLAGCTSTAPKENAYGGFLGDYNGFTKQEASDGVAVMGWVAPHLATRGYDAVILDPVVFFTPPKNHGRVSDKTRADILSIFNKKLRTVAGSKARLVNDPGPGVARIRIALTSIDAGFRDLRWYEFTPVTFATTTVASAAGVRSEAVEVIVEAELLDSLTSERLAAAVRRGIGKDVSNSSAPIEIKNIEPVLDEWANSLGIFLSETIAQNSD